MPGRRTHQDVVLYSIGGSDWFEVGRAFNFRQSVRSDEVQAFGENYKEAIAVKRGQTFDFEILYARTPADAVMTNLDVSVFTLGGVNHLGNLRDATIRISVDTGEMSGVADFAEFPGALMRDMEISGTLQVNAGSGIGNPYLSAIASGATGSSQKVAVALSVGATPSEKLKIVSAYMLITELSHRVDHGAVQEWTIAMRLAQQLTDTQIPSANNNTLLYSVLRGTAQVAFDIQTGSANYSSAVGLITALNVTIRDASVIRLDGTIAVQGAATIT